MCKRTEDNLVSLGIGCDWLFRECEECDPGGTTERRSSEKQDQPEPCEHGHSDCSCHPEE